MESLREKSLVGTPRYDRTRSATALERSSKIWSSSSRRWVATVAAVAWCLACLLALVAYTPRANSAVRDLLLSYFQPLLPIGLALWLWGHNVQRFHALGIDYEMCFAAKDRKHLLSHPEVYRIALALTCICLTGAAAFVVCAEYGAYSAADLAPVVVYFLAFMLLVAPLDVLNMQARLFFGVTLQRVLLPVQEVTWADFLLADITTSLSKSSGDLAKAAAALFKGPALRMHVVTHVAAGHAGGVIPRAVDPLAPTVLGALCLPYAIRFVQCLIVNRTTGNRSQLFNAAKYATAFPALVLTAIEHEYHISGQRYPLYGWWLAAMAINSLYSYYWDLEMDWDMPWLVQPGGQTVLRVLRLPGLKPDTLFPRWFYGAAAASNLLLRLSWMHRLVGDLEAHNTVLIVMALLEVYRRYQWTYIRVETEIRKIRLRQAHEHEDDRAGPGLLVTHDQTS